MEKEAKIVLGLFVFVLLIGSLVGDNSENMDANNEDSLEAPETEPLEILDHQLQKGENGTYKVVGSAKAHKSLSYAEVKVKVYDEDGALIRTFLDDINDLEEGENWDFEVGFFVLGKEVADYEIAVGSCR